MENKKKTLKNIYLYTIIIIYFYYVFLHFLLINIYSEIDKLLFAILVITLFLFFLYNILEFKKFLIIKTYINIFILIFLSTELFFTLFKNFAPLKTVPHLFFKNNNKVVESLSVNPWYKFKSNTVIYSKFYRGDDFIYFWKSDELGFKNLPGISQDNNVYAIALGNSFTEGMGNRIKDTWPTLLSQKIKKNIYNLGVQGYAPIQFEGTFNLLKDKINFEKIFIGHLSGIYKRNKKYTLDKIKSATGGIEYIRVDKGSIYTVQIIQYCMDYFKHKFIEPSLNKKEFKNYNSILREKKLVEKYSQHVSLNKLSKADLENDSDWINTVISYVRIAEWAKQNNKELYIILFPHRSQVYFPDIVSSTFDLEKELIISSLESYNINIIDLKIPLIEYTKKNQDKLPYFLTDGHLSKFGNEVVSEEISRILINE